MKIESVSFSALFSLHSEAILALNFFVQCRASPSIYLEYYFLFIFKFLKIKLI